MFSRRGSAAETRDSTEALLPVEKENFLPFRDVFSGGGLFAGVVFAGDVKNWLQGGG